MFSTINDNTYLLYFTFDLGAATLLLELSESNNNFIIKEWCCYGFYCLSRNCLCPGQLLSQEILPCLLRICETATERIKYFCAGVLAQISQITYLNTSSAIITAVNMMKSEKNTSKYVYVHCYRCVVCLFCYYSVLLCYYYYYTIKRVLLRAR